MFFQNKKRNSLTLNKIFLSIIKIEEDVKSSGYW
jgi:hypothetical protein